jgi:hypothetical protein
LKAGVPAGASVPPEAAAPRAGQRVGLGELVSCVSALALLICIFAMAWFGRVGPSAAISGIGRASSVDGWTALTDARWLMMITILLCLGSLALHIGQSAHGSKSDSGLLTLLVSLPTAVLVSVRVLVALPSPESIVDVKLGGYLGLLLCVGVALGGWRTLQEERGLGAGEERRSRRRR